MVQSGWVLSSVLVALGGLHAASPSTGWPRNASPERSGIYVERSAAEPLRLEMTLATTGRATGVAKSMMTGGFAKPGLAFTLPGESAAVRLPPTATFIFVIKRQAGPAADPMAMMQLAMEMPPGASHPKEFMLRQLSVKDGDRELDSKKARKAELEIEAVEPSVYRVRSKAPLEPGEYAFAYSVGGQPAGQIWEFGVDK